MRRLIDRTYAVAGVAAALSLFAIFALVGVQVLARLLDGLLRLAGADATGFIIPSIAEICGFLLAAASFLALAHTLAVGGHIRVGLVIERLSPGPRRIVEASVGMLALALSLFATYALAGLAWKSFTYDDVSYGIIAVPLWIPQATMTLGLAILSVAILDVTIRAWRRSQFLSSSEA